MHKKLMKDIFEQIKLSLHAYNTNYRKRLSLAGNSQTTHAWQKHRPLSVQYNEL